jgi:hypothetical protein
MSNFRSMNSAADKQPRPDARSEVTTSTPRLDTRAATVGGYPWCHTSELRAARS